MGLGDYLYHMSSCQNLGVSKNQRPYQNSRAPVIEDTEENGPQFIEAATCGKPRMTWILKKDSVGGGHNILPTQNPMSTLKCGLTIHDIDCSLIQHEDPTNDDFPNAPCNWVPDTKRGILMFTWSCGPPKWEL